jgi:hypothetical protein
MGLFGRSKEKKTCCACGKELGIMGKRKLEDGYVCKDCASQLSPWFSERRKSTCDDINQQLADREANKAKVAAFNPTLTLGGNTKVYIDETAGTFMVTSNSRWRDANPDIIELSQVTGCNYNVEESRTEIKRKMPDGSEQSFNPPRYDIDYDFYETINVNCRWFDEIHFKVNPHRIENLRSAEYQEAERQANEIREALMGARNEARQNIAAANAPKMAAICPNCGASCIPDANGRCEYCGGAMF